jgi:hypothetical protein
MSSGSDRVMKRSMRVSISVFSTTKECCAIV